MLAIQYTMKMVSYNKFVKVNSNLEYLIEMGLFVELTVIRS